jgi:hypothetical protein
MKRSTITISAGVAVTLFGCPLGFYFVRAIPFAEQWPVYDGLRQTAAIIFGITGAWAAIVYPGAISTLVSRKRFVGSSTDNAVSRLVRPMAMSTLIITVVLLAGLAARVARRTAWVAEHFVALRGASFALLVALTVFELFAVAFLLLPMDDAVGEVERQIGTNRILANLGGVQRTDEGHR